MRITGRYLIGREAVRGTNGEIHAVNAFTGERMDPAFGCADAEDVERACSLAWAAFDTYREFTPDARANFLEAIATNILMLGDELVDRCVAETGLARERIEGERGRTVGQLRMFAGVVRAGDHVGARIDPAMPERKPLPRVDLRLRQIPLGPVVVFGASNFPLAFSVAGGDTASALAAGCPVVVKAHSSHPGTSELVGQAIQEAVRTCGMPEGTFSMLFGSGRDVGQALVRDPRIKAAGFTGSQQAGVELMKIAAARAEPIPVYAEMSSINPVVLFPQALAARGEAIAEAFVKSLTLGAGQFCTNPGLVLAVEGPELEHFVETAVRALTQTHAATMLTPSIRRSYEDRVATMAGQPGVATAARGNEATSEQQARAALFVTDMTAFASQHALREEMFGAASLIVRCPSLEAMLDLIESLEGQLTTALHMDEGDYAAARKFLPVLERHTGRILVNGFGTGVEVGHAMVHGGPYPSTSDGRSTSVGSLAIHRFMRAVSYQDMPEALLPAALQSTNPLGLNRLIDGKPVLAARA
ncbi:aldehyde dehydrogenase (NADP(+)) [Paraburkholderia tropica]|uniref:aldehyde dehydrogenase (NADP(+)) n=1 Tax=Paraburkholderia tropica TaxID=92647 RepID=UPI0016215F82|nr:aldehyde dehydrogenase (NADP(+)) [Paraburkholderia tropica]MBB2981431.1 NADP-dependent aldehyde dehydrogenase [Paraburkholderia tropica]